MILARINSGNLWRKQESVFSSLRRQVLHKSNEEIFISSSLKGENSNMQLKLQGLNSYLIKNDKKNIELIMWQCFFSMWLQLIGTSYANYPKLKVPWKQRCSSGIRSDLCPFLLSLSPHLFSFSLLHLSVILSLVLTSRDT